MLYWFWPFFFFFASRAVDDDDDDDEGDDDDVVVVEVDGRNADWDDGRTKALQPVANNARKSVACFANFILLVVYFFL